MFVEPLRVTDSWYVLMPPSPSMIPINSARAVLWRGHMILFGEKNLDFLLWAKIECLPPLLLPAIVPGFSYFTAQETPPLLPLAAAYQYSCFTCATPGSRVPEILLRRR